MDHKEHTPRRYGFVYNNAKNVYRMAVSEP